MGDQLSVQRIKLFLIAVGDRIQATANLVLLGGSGLSMLGNRRPTLDLDYDGEELSEDKFRELLEQVAHEMRIELKC